MTLLEALAVLAAGVAAGTINVVVGSGTLITFPVLLAVGFPPVTANVSNTIGLVPGSFSGVVGYRRELATQTHRLLQLSIASVTGGIVGAVALLELPASAFEAIVPVFIVIALVLIIIQPRLAKRLASRRPAHARPGPVTTGLVFGTGVYGGYFGAAQGILLLGILGATLPGGPPARQRDQEPPGDAREPRVGHHLRVRRARRLGGGGADRRRLDRRRRARRALRAAPAAAGASGA